MINFPIVTSLLYISGPLVRVLSVRTQVIEPELNLPAKLNVWKLPPQANVIIGKIVLDRSLEEWCEKHPKECDDGAIKTMRKYPTLSEYDFQFGLHIFQDAVREEWRSASVNGWLGLAGIKVSKIATFDSALEEMKIKKILWSDEIWKSSSTTIFEVLASDEVQAEHRLMVEWERSDWYAKNGAWDINHPGFIMAWTPESIEPGPAGKLLIGNEISRISHSDLRPKDITLLVHRYVSNVLNISARWIYHEAALLTWLTKDGADPGFVTLVELAWLNGAALAASKRSYVWYSEPEAKLWDAISRLHPFMHAPAQSQFSEIRVFDVPMNVTSFKTFFKETGVSKNRWVDPHMGMTVEVKSDMNRGQVMESLRNYIRNKPGYDQMSDNCQTFVADLVRYLTLKKVDIFGVGGGIYAFVRDLVMKYTPHPEFFT